MPCSAAALVTSGSLAAPSSIEYSVCTCRCTNESDGALLTGGRAPQWSCVPDRRLIRRATGGEDRRCRISVGGAADPRTAEGLLRGSDRTCRPGRTDPSHRPRGLLPQRAAHRDV